MATGGEGHSDTREEEGQRHPEPESPDPPSSHDPTGLPSVTAPDSPPLPSPRRKPVAERVDTAGHPLVFFNVETTGFKRYSHITQIAACTDHDRNFNTFVRPNDSDINFELPYAEEASGITITVEGMLHHGQSVEFLTIRPALEQFIDFLGQQQQPVVLVGHTIQSFGSRPLVKALQNCDLIDRFQEVVHCFVDIYLLLKGMGLPELGDCKIPTLYNYCREENIGPSDARKDAETLMLITQRVDLQSDQLTTKSFTIEYIVEDLRYAEEKVQSQWTILKNEDFITNAMVEKALRNGLEFDEVRRQFQDHGEEAVRQLLRERLTRKEEIINRICDYLRQGVPE